MKQNIYANLPRVVLVISVEDGGPMEAGNCAHCPHCGAEGRYIYNFTCEDGKTYGAMKGCFDKFPKHPFAKMAGVIMGKEKEYARKGWKLASWDTEILAAIEDFANGKATEQAAQDRIRAATGRKKAYMARKGYKQPA